MIALVSRTALDPVLVAVAAVDPVREADLAARVALAGHVVTGPAQAEILLADAESPALAIGESPPAAACVLRMGPGAPLPLDLSPAQLDAALRATAAGLQVTLAPLPRTSRDTARPAADTFEARPLLTPRELEILACLGEGLSNKAVARRLGISAHTVKFHLEAIFAKLGATTRADAVARGLRGGLILL